MWLMKQLLLMIAVVALVGCGTTSSKVKRTGDKEEVAEHGLKFIKGRGWVYIKPPPSNDINRMSAPQIMERVNKAMKEERYSDAMFDAKFFMQKFPGTDGMPKMRRIVVQIEELQKALPKCIIQHSAKK